MIVLQFSSQNKIGSKLIQWFTWSDYSHVDFVLPDGRLLGARGDGVKVREPYPVSDKLIATVDAGDEVIERALTQIGKPYDYCAIIAFPFRREWQDDQAWFCSEFALWAFQKEGYNILNSKHLERIVPRDLLLSPRLEY